MTPRFIWRILLQTFDDDILLYLSLVGMGIYLSQERPDLSFGIKELAGKMASRTQLSVQRVKKFLGCVKGTTHYMNYVKFPKDGMGFLKQSDSKEWVFESFSDSDWAGDRATRRSTS